MKHWQKALLFRRRADEAMERANNLQKPDEYRRAWAIIARDWVLVAEKEEKLAEGEEP